MPVSTAMILAAGRGERLRPLTDRIPKPLIFVGQHRLIEYHLKALASIGIQRVVVNVSHLADVVRGTLGDGSHFNVEIIYSPEPPGALETAGGIRNALPLLGNDPFLVINGDILCDIALDSLSLAGASLMHLVLVPNPQHHPEGDFGLDSDSTPPRLITPSPTDANLTYAGLGVFSPDPFHHLGHGPYPLAPLIHQCIIRKQASGQRYDGYWKDVGNAERLEEARRDMRESKKSFSSTG